MLKKYQDKSCIYQDRNEHRKKFVENQGSYFEENYNLNQ